MTTPDISLGTGLWSWSPTAGAPPASKSIRTDSGDWLAASQLYISDTDNNNANRAAGLDTLKVDDLIRLEHNTDSTRYVLYTVTSPAVADVPGVFHTIAVAYKEGGGTLPTNNSVLQVIAASALTPGAPIGHMYIDLLMHDQITEDMANDMMRDISLNLQTITHLVNYASFQANVAGEILLYEEAILPAMTGEVTPVPNPDWEL